MESAPQILPAREALESSEERERILAAAYELFAREGIRAVGIDAIVERAGVSQLTLYRHFESKDELVLAFLARREQLWTKEWLEAEVERRAAEPRERLLAIFDVSTSGFAGTISRAAPSSTSCSRSATTTARSTTRA